MKITSATFMRGISGDNDILNDPRPQIAFIGRSNAGKSSLLNCLTGNGKLARTSKTPGRTREINIFLINNTHYFMDLPGYGFAKTKIKTLDKISKHLGWYLFNPNYNQKIVMLVDSNVGPTADDLEMLSELEKTGKEIVVVLNKVDKIKKSQYQNQLKKLAEQIPGHKLIPFSSKTKVGLDELLNELLIK
jgi:GTP-binding protein